MKILITGVNGFVGSQIKKYYSKNGNILIGVDSKNFKNKFKHLIRKKTDFDLIFHCAGSGIVGIKKLSYKIHYNKNYASTIQLINFIKKSNLKNCKIIFFSSQAVYAKSEKKIKENYKIFPSSYYGKTKLMAEKKLIKIKNNSIIILRLFSIYGKGLKKQIMWDTCKKFKNKKNNFFGNGEEIRDFLNIKDLMILLKKIVNSKFQPGFNIYNVGSGKGTKIRKIIDLIKSNFKIGKKIIFNDIKNSSENRNFISSNIKVEKKFSWRPKTILKKEILIYVKWFKKI